MEEKEMFYVYEGHMPALRKKINTIRRKCEKYGGEFSYMEVGEEFRDIPTDMTDSTGKKITVKCRYILIQAEGTAVINDWEFIASVEHTEAGNIFAKALTDVEIPVRYRTGPCTCEHCKTDRIRKDTFIIRNTRTGEFKQVGKSCLRDYTGGMSASAAAYFASLKQVFEEAEEKPVTSWTWYQRYYDTEEVLRYAAETIRKFGFSKSENQDDTRTRMRKFFDIDHGNTKFWSQSEIEEVKNLMKKVGFDPESAGAVKMTGDALEWIRNQETTNDYMHNLKTVCALKEVHSGRFGLLVSLFPSYDRNLEYQEQKRKEIEKDRQSRHIGSVGERITVEIESVKCITSWESNFGYRPVTTYVWKIADKAGNVFTWKTSAWINEEKPPGFLKGTVREHKVYRGTDQTELTRCKLYNSPPE